MEPARSPTPFFARQDWLALALAAALDSPLIFLGYGADNDSYMVLDSGRLLLGEHRYVPSRNPGYFLYELINAALSRLGGSVLTNLGTLGMSLGIVILFLRLCRRFDIPHRGLLAAIMIVQPYFWSASTSTMDYNWAICLLLAGFVCILNDRQIPAGALLGLSIGMRLSSFIGAGVFLVYDAIVFRRSPARVAAAWLLTTLIGAACYWPSLRWADYTLRFLEPAIGAAEFWTPLLRLGRWVYKNLYMWGFAAACVLAVMAILAARDWRTFRDARWQGLTLVSLGVCGGYEALYLKYPIQPDYLLPLLPFLLILLGIAFQRRPRWLIALLVAVAFGLVARVNVSQPILRNGGAVGARFGFWLEQSWFVYELRYRWRLRHCDTLACYETVPRPEPLEVKFFEFGAMNPDDNERPAEKAAPPTRTAPSPTQSDAAPE